MSTAWYENDACWEDLLPVLFPESRRAAAVGEVASLLALAGLKPRQEGASAPTRILDLACGIGRHSLELARRGYQVTGVDRTRLYLERAIRQAREEGLAVEFHRDDMRRFRRPGSFDAVINLFTSFGYFPDPEDDRLVLENVHTSLKPGGVFVLDLIGKEVLARIFRERDWHRDEGLVVMEERSIRQAWSWVESRWTILYRGRKTEVELSHRLYSAAELGALLSSAGFLSVEVYGDLEGSLYDHNARRLVLLARR